MSNDQIQPHTIIVMGATGDLMRRKLLPALHRLADFGHLQGCCHTLGVARNTTFDDSKFQNWALDALTASGLANDEHAERWCKETLRYQAVQEASLDEYRVLARRIEQIENANQIPGNRIFYLALPPTALRDALRCLGKTGLNKGPGWTRLVIEKPFGEDFDTARDLNNLIHRYFDESQIYRIDHYLGKETVKNLLVFRFANTIFESQWNRDHIDNIQITVAEELGIEGRGRYYEQAGALRDMVQSHLMQLLALTAMEPPTTFEAEQVRYEKVKVLKAIAPILPEDVAFGHYTAGTVNGKSVIGYRQEEGVAADSHTETYAAVRLNVDTWRWQGVPFCIRTGKRMAKRLTQIAVSFRRPPVCLFQSFGACQIHTNVLLMTIQPDEGFSLFFDVKAPGQELRLNTLPLQFHYKDVFGELPDAYHTLLIDILKGDQTLFVHADETEESWRLYTPILRQGLPNYPYTAGTWGPSESEVMLNRGGKSWFMT